MRKTIAIDFDGTLFENEWPGIGPAKMDVIQAALAEQRNGAALILWTCREGEQLQAALDACARYGLSFDAVNDSTEEWKQAWGTSPRKVGASEYWDDRALNPLTSMRFSMPEYKRRQGLTRGVSRRGE